MSAAAPPVTFPRLRFIDMARAVAILLMLEGHFVDVTLAPQFRDASHPAYIVWLYGRGLAAPLFFTVTGLIFAFLLSGAKEPGFWGVKRVRKGVLRAAEISAWAYLLQVDFKKLPGVFRGVWDPWLQGFHVLQCIAVGLLLMIGIFGVVRNAGPKALAASYIGAGLLDFLLAVWLANHPGMVPAGAPAWFQNAFKGPTSVFPMAPWLAFTFYGAAIGVLVRHRGGGSESGVNPWPFLFVGMILKNAGWWFDRWLGVHWLDLLGTAAEGRVIPENVHGRIGEILLLLGALVWIERRFHSCPDWFLAIGRNTFPIYVGHVIVLFGGIFGISLLKVWGHALNPWQAALGAAMFCAVFALFAQTVEPIARRWNAWRSSGTR